MYSKFAAVLFDCDGVLVDSEPITNGLLRDMLEEQGWKLTPEACFQHFVGKAVIDEKLAIEANTGKPLTEAWMIAFRARRNAALETHLQAIPNIHAAIEQIHLSFEGRIACASGADRLKVELQLAKVDLMPYFEGRIFSGHEMPRSKPAPDVYLAAAAAGPLPGGGRGPGAGPRPAPRPGPRHARRETAGRLPQSGPGLAGNAGIAGEPRHGPAGASTVRARCQPRGAAGHVPTS